RELCLMNKTAEVGLLLVTFSPETGPYAFLKDSNLDEAAVLFLSVRGFTIIMAGMDYKFHGPGKIRGTLAIPNTEDHAIAFDFVLPDKTEKRDKRIQQYSPLLFFLLVPKNLLQTVRIHLDEIENLLQTKTKDLEEKSDVNSHWFKQTVSDVRAYIHDLSKITIKDSQSSLYDATVLLSLPSASNRVAQAILRIQREISPKGATIRSLIQETGLKEEELNEELNYLSGKGLIEIHELNHEIFFVALKPK
ncbi:MAG: hypothetical protein ACFFC7_23565, partial [Candidatus Hermodarchaeota archaeon]